MGLLLLSLVLLYRITTVEGKQQVCSTEIKGNSCIKCKQEQEQPCLGIYDMLSLAKAFLLITLSCTLL